jgi:hypothetical protein
MQSATATAVSHIFNRQTATTKQQRQNRKRMRSGAVQCLSTYTMDATKYTNVYASLLSEVNRVAEFWRIAAEEGGGRDFSSGVEVPGIEQ